ncbi:TPA: DUF2780 domain-containing protein [Vibrio campbellii]|uniref:DUF2780 domain-containing protein n=1 Tax=Vibrio sp. M260121 TaxID=3020897 RepID=UPI002F3FE7AE|nr:DUF2780 domain-containing protein [Vibrio campbellii]HDM8244832.1 DUF2780 domain-containing protein [Vibrio campbellii]
MILKNTVMIIGVVYFLSGCNATPLATKENPVSLSDVMNKSVGIEGAGSELTHTLSDHLGVTSAQAAGGASALLALAQNQLSKQNNIELSSLLSANVNSGFAENLLNGADNISAVQNVFTGLGLDTSMINQFAPILLEFLGAQGASSELLQSLSALWL